MSDEIEQQKDVEFYAASVAAWYNTSLEHDKSLFALSAGGIGLLITLLTTVGLPSAWLLGLYIAALTCFLSCLIVILVIFRRNGPHIEQLVSTRKATDTAFLARLDSIALYGFGAGAVFAVLIGISTAVNSYEKGIAMANENKGSTPTRSQTQDSFSGAASLQKSFTGAANLQPQQPVASTAAPTPAPAPAPAPAQAVASTGGTTSTSSSKSGK